MNYKFKIAIGVIIAFICLAFFAFLGSIVVANTSYNTKPSFSEINLGATSSDFIPIENITDETMNLLLVSMGQTQEELIHILGEGTVVKDKDDTVVSRIYERVILEEPVRIHVNLSLDDTVSSATLTLNNGTFEEWKEKLTNTLGEVSVLDVSPDISIAEWNLSCAVTTLQKTESLELIFVALPT